MVKEQMEEIKKAMILIEWDMEHSKTDSKSKVYENLKKDYEELQKKFERGE